MGRVILHPSVLFSLVWFMALFLHLVCRFTVLPGLFTLSINTQVTFALGVLVFTLGSLLQSTLFKFPTNIQTEFIKQPPLNFSLRAALIIILIVGLPFYINASYRLFLASQADEFLTGLRHQISYGDEDIGPVKYLMTLSFVVLGINLYEYFRKKSSLNLVLLIIVALATIAYAILSTGRTYYVIILLLYVGINFLYSRRVSIAKYASLLVIFLMLFSLVGIVMGKGGNAQSSAKENINESASTTAIYFVSALSAYDLEQKDIYLPYYNGNNTLRFFVLIGQKLGLKKAAFASELLQPFVFIPYGTNVYTFYSPYSKDFGVAYALGMLFLFSLLSCWLYNKARSTGTLRYVLYYCFSLYPLLLSIFQDQYMSLLSTWIQIVLILEIILFFDKFLKPKLNG